MGDVRNSDASYETITNSWSDCGFDIEMFLKDFLWPVILVLQPINVVESFVQCPINILQIELIRNIPYPP